MRRPPASAVALALLLGACVARAQHAATATPAAVTNVSYCAILEHKTVERAAAPMLGWRSVSYGRRAAIVTLVWGSEPAHAAAALLGALLRHVRRYRDVHVPRAPHPHATANLAAEVKPSTSGQYNDLVIGVSTAWDPEVPRSCEPKLGPHPGIAGPRLAEFGLSSVPARRRLFAWLGPTARVRPACLKTVRWAFYPNQTALADCDFVDTAYPQSSASAVEVLGVGDCDTTLKELKKRANATKTLLHLRHVDRTAFVHTLQTTNRSFLFLDYDMWKGVPGVSVVEPPPCVPLDFGCKQELDSTIAMRVADVDILQSYAPQLFQFIYDFNPSLTSLRQILERQASGVDIEEAGCEWALENKKYIIGNNDRKKYDLYKYIVATYLCLGDPSNGLYENIINSVGGPIYDQTSNVGCDIQLRRYLINCSDNYNMSNRLDDFTRTKGIYSLVGVVSMAVEGAEAASGVAAASRVPLMLADVVPEAGTDARTTWRVAGRPRHIAYALRHFVRASGWTRVGVLSQPTNLAADYNAALKDKAEIILRDFPIPPHLTDQQAEVVLQELQATNTRIVFVNADSQAAHTILTAAVARGMGYSDGFVWILREWRQNNVPCATKHFTVSFWARGVEDIPAADGWEGSQLRKNLNKLARPWPPRAVSLANALLTLTIGFKDVFERFPNTRQDLHSDQMIRSLQESLIKTPVTGVGSQRLRYKERSLEETFVFVDQWCGSEFQQRLATWRVNATSGVVRGKSEVRARTPATPALEESLVNQMDTSPIKSTALEAPQELNLDILRAELSKFKEDFLKTVRNEFQLLRDDLSELTSTLNSTNDRMSNLEERVAVLENSHTQPRVSSEVDDIIND